MDDFKVTGESVMKKRWNDKGIAENYTQERFSDPIWEFMHDNEVQVVNDLIKPGSTILDIATGPARVAKDLTGDFNGIAVDFAEEMLEVAKKLLDTKRWKIQKADAFALSFPPESFDLVTSFRFVRHFELADRVKIYSQVKKVLKPNGHFVFEALNKNMNRALFKPQFTGAADRSIYDELYDKGSLTKELKDNGFKVESITPNLSHGNLYTSVSRILPKNLLFSVFTFLDKIDTGDCFQWEVVARSL